MIVNYEYFHGEKYGGIVLQQYTGENPVVVIPSSIDGCPVVHIGGGMFGGCFITDITIPDSVTSACDAVFDGITNQDGSFNETGLGLTVTYKGKTYIKTRCKNEKTHEYYFDFPKELYRALWDGIKYKHCNECLHYFISSLPEYTTATWGNCQKVRKDFNFRGQVSAGDWNDPVDTVHCDVKVSTWCPVNECGFVFTPRQGAYNVPSCQLRGR